MTLSSYQLSYQISPIVLVGGIAGTGMLPIVNLLGSQNYSGGVTSSSDLQQGTEAFGQFRVLAGHTLMDMEVATYPFANQSVAANAVIVDPLKVSLEMLVPATDQVTVTSKQSVMTALKSTLDNHTAKGGWYNIATPSYIYQGCLLTSLIDATDDPDGAQVQVRWIWNFMQPLLTAAAAQAAQNQAMAKISTQTQNSGDPPGSQPVATGVGQPSANIAQNLVPAAAGPAGSNVAPSNSSANINVSSVSPIAPGG